MSKNEVVREKTFESQDFSKVVLTNRDCYFIRDNFHLLKGLTGFIFVREANRNLSMIEGYLKSLSATIEPTEEYKKGYLKDLAELEVLYADKDKEGEVLRDSRRNPIINSRIFEFQKEVEKLQKRHEKEFKLHESKIKEFNENFDKPAPLTLYTFSEKQVPQNISIEQYKVIMHMIDYEKGVLGEDEEDREEKKKTKK